VRALANYIMRGRIQAVSVVVLGALLSLTIILLPLIFISGAALALVTLRRGVVQGLTVLFYSVLVLVTAAMLLLGDAVGVLQLVIPIWIPALFLAELLRRNTSLSATVSIAAMFALLGIIITYMILGDPSSHWQASWIEALTLLGASEVLSDPAFIQALELMSRIYTGLAATGFWFMSTMVLFVARWWQATLYNEGGFREEFHSYRMSRWFVWPSLLVLLAMSFSSLDEMSVAQQLSIELGVLVLSLYTLQGIAVAHRMAAIAKLNKVWLILMYVLLLTPQFNLLMALTGLVDNWLDIRTRFARVKGQQDR